MGGVGEMKEVATYNITLCTVVYSCVQLCVTHLPRLQRCRRGRRRGRAPRPVRGRAHEGQWRVAGGGGRRDLQRIHLPRPRFHVLKSA